ncbi:peptidoglycan editing factor PgeF [Psychrosphaera ytuae]|uniref:Purine nucleoside phosphorylase n=1 Tax=Psychrosphaera ytuae TaxID=2820710 RepID=A0A975DCJ0_9GAMM|nr:peptidoglycan editing factor PgeF [Psychrosphaera ytuae]QTH63836.1 peptidoglycan editing factor PgeF [Psychrosphaera ytuae]
MIWTSATFKGLDPDLLERLKAGTTRRCIGVDAGSSEQRIGVSLGVYDSLNIATHVGDDLTAVMTNRAILREQLRLPSEPYWLNQTHTIRVVELPYEYRSHMEADACFTQLTNTICTVMTADCLPILMVDVQGRVVSAVHAGWRGLLNGIVANTIRALPVNADELSVWIGPAISKAAFEVGSEVRQSFVDKWPQSADMFVTSTLSDNADNKYMCDLPGIAVLVLQELGVSLISLSNECSYQNQQYYYSYRRDGQCGRMASMIWLEDK